ncbi:MAG: hypothetical protein JSU94_10735 [Phycisphaerales bacterium]|nr:MAG: hypothetical protein JSU94_10735 [Phycisphaerales bacterium]
MERSRSKKMGVLLIGGVLCIFAMLAARALAVADGGGASPDKWQYLAFKSKIESDSPTAEAGKTITKLGKDGWELIGVENHIEAGTTTKTVYYFKRRL